MFIILFAVFTLSIILYIIGFFSQKYIKYRGDGLNWIGRLNSIGILSYQKVHLKKVDQNSGNAGSSPVPPAQYFFEYFVLLIQVKGNTPTHLELDREDFIQQW